jgi:hypothetical protein
MKEVDEKHICGLDMQGGLASNIKYPQQFVKAPKSQYPSTPSHPGKEIPNSEAMKITCHA